MRMNYTKVKPTVVKHVLPNEVMHIRDPQVSLKNFFLHQSILTFFHIVAEHRFTRTNSTCTRLRMLGPANIRATTQLELQVAVSLRPPRCRLPLPSRVFGTSLARTETRSKTRGTSLKRWKAAWLASHTSKTTCSQTIQIQIWKTKQWNL